MKMCLVVKNGRLRFRQPVLQRENNRFVILPASVTTIFVLASPFFGFSDGNRVFLFLVGVFSVLFWVAAFSPPKSERAEKLVTGCLTSRHLDQFEGVFKEAVSSQLSQLARRVTEKQADNPLCPNPPEKEEFRRLFDAAKTLQLTGPVVTYGDFFCPEKASVVHED